MRLFVCLLDLHGRGIPDSVRGHYESFPRSRKLPFQWHAFDHASVLTVGDDSNGEPLVATEDHAVAVGIVRLDNRDDLREWSASQCSRISDLQLVLRTVTQQGARYIPQILGDFAFVTWNGNVSRAVAAVDAFAVKKLYYAESHGLLALASRGEALAAGNRYEVQYLAERLAKCFPTPGLSVYEGVKCLPGGTVATIEHGVLSRQEYWAPSQFQMEPAFANAEREAVEICRDLLADSVRLRLDGNGTTWAELSGGMDSSSVVSVAQWLEQRGAVTHGVSGTVTWVDTHGTGADERRYSDAVAHQWQLRNEKIIDSPIWHDDQYPLPQTDEPTTAFALHPRNHRLCQIVRGAGGRVLLTGVGGDELFTGNMFFFADWIVKGHAWRAACEMARRAALGRVSFWELAYRNALLPLLPPRVQASLVRDEGCMPSWMARETARRYELDIRAVAPLSYAGRLGSKYHDAIGVGVASIRSGLSAGLIEDNLDVRHPFLYRPLVELALRLPPELCARPHARKWVVREAMHGILPEVVRTRIGKGVIVGLLAWSAVNQQELLEPLVREPILAELGIIDRAKLRAAFAAAPLERVNRERSSAALQYTLAVEAWLQMRSGRWPRGDRSAVQRRSDNLMPPT